MRHNVAERYLYERAMVTRCQRQSSSIIMSIIIISVTQAVHGLWCSADIWWEIFKGEYDTAIYRPMLEMMRLKSVQYKCVNVFHINKGLNYIELCSKA